MFIKLGELSNLSVDNIQTTDSVLAELSDKEINDRFSKFASQLKKIAPKANDFLYFTSVVMHAAEASLIDDNGNFKKKADGTPVRAYWDKSNGGYKWICDDPNIKPYANSNRDCFPEEELLKAHRDWIGRPLCIDHQSSSVDAVRGVVLDTYYDRKFKRVMALCALDKVSFPELAKGVASGYKTSTSMGCGVSFVCCSYNCPPASNEHEFCKHLKTKTSEYEVNIGLKPIEYSIVVTPADSRAKIRTILASANLINSTLSNAEKEFSVIASNEKAHHQELDKIKALEDVLKDATEKLSELKKAIETEEKSDSNASSDANYGQSSGQVSSPVDQIDQNSTSLNFPQRFASNLMHNETLLGELKNLKSSIERKLSTLEPVLNKFNKEEIMSASDRNNSMNKEAYFQGGGGVNEPTPGKAKYEKDPLNEHLRSNEDKQMKGQPPFPEVGDVEGMHPSPESVMQKDELERKKLIQRAEAEQRAMRRAAAVQKAKENVSMDRKAYFQGGGGVNEPTPGKQKYDVDPLNEKARDKEDKQMNGQKPFPGVGDVEGLHPSPASADEKDELKRKEMLQRASLKARFVRVANADGTDNQAKSAWNVFVKDASGEKLVLTASVEEISGGRTEALYDVIATKEFGSKMLEKVRSVGLSKAASLYKQSQAVAGAGATPGMPMDMGGAAPVPAMPEAPASEEPKAEDEGGKGDPKDTAVALAEEMRDKASDLVEAVRSLTGEQAEMGDLDQSIAQLPKAAKAELAPLNNMRKELNGALLSAMKRSVAELKENYEEMNLIASVLEDGLPKNKEYVNTLVEDAFSDAKEALAESTELLRAFVKYARGASGLVRRAEEITSTSMKVVAEKAHEKTTKTHDSDECMVDDNNVDPGDPAELDFSDLLPEEDEDFEMEENHHHHDTEFPGEEPDTDMDISVVPEDGEGEDENNVMVDVPETKLDQVGKELGGLKPAQASFDCTTKEGRAAFRAQLKLAADATGKLPTGESEDVSKMKYQSDLADADKLADGNTKLDTKPEGDLGKVETPAEVQKKMLEVAKAPAKVRKDAERLHQLISEGKVAEKDLDQLVAHGLDSETVKYWRQYYGMAGKEGSEFGKLLTTETMKAKAEDEMKTYKVKVARAYELANDMVRRGLLADDRVAIANQVEEIMNWNDEGFESMKRVIAKHAFKKEASANALPQIGLIQDENRSTVEVDFQSELDRAFSGRKY